MPTVVVVDDDPQFTQAITALLSLAGHIVSAHLSCAAAQEFLSANSADALVADLHLQNGSAWDLITFARQGQPGLGVVVVSGSYDPLVEENARRLGVAVLTMPFDPDDLIGVINGMTRGG